MWLLVVVAVVAVVEAAVVAGKYVKEGSEVK
jgi:hypothetical protein